METLQRALNVAVLLLATTAFLYAQRGTGELRLTVTDATGLPLFAEAELVSQANQQRRNFRTEANGFAAVKDLPLGVYKLTVSRGQFVPYSRILEIRSELPVEVPVRMELAGAATTLVIADSETLLDPHQTGTVFHIGRDRIESRRTALPSRGLLELVESQPGWLLEANGVLHPRGAEYNTQYVIDGIPMIDNRSPGFAPSLDVEDLYSMNVMTANYPAEYGRKLGGIVEVTTARVDDPGLHLKTALQAGSFDTQSGYAAGQYLKGRTAVSLSANAGRTGRYLDPPVEENFTNRGRLAGFSARLDYDLNESDRLRFYGYRQQSGFLVPNDYEQQQAGQRQDRTAGESMGQAVYQRVLTPRALLHVRGMVRDLTTKLWSNELATPLSVDQNRGFREYYANGSVVYSRGGHEWKWGGEWIGANLRESFGYRITDADEFEDDVPARFRFAGRARSREAALFVQDLIRLGNWTLSAGLRWDRYRLLVRENAWSPRLGVARYFPDAGLVVRASYDRAFEVPAIENLLLASSSEARGLTEESAEIPVKPARGHFWQAGFSKTLGRLRLDANWYRRNIRNYGDDDVLLNTGVSFPISFDRANIHGYEAKLEIPRWGPISGFISYANLVGTGYLPVTGGLFLDADDLEESGSFPITQDQRNTAQSRVRWHLSDRIWLGGGMRYGSGLPVEFEEEPELGDFTDRILARVDLERGRVRPALFLDLAGGAEIWRKERRSVRMQADIINATNRLNLINFAGIFSGTALAAPRSISVRMNLEF